MIGRVTLIFKLFLFFLKLKLTKRKSNAINNNKTHTRSLKMMTIYVLTNGCLDSECAQYNYVCAFRSQEAALKFAKTINIHLKYDYYEIEVPEEIVAQNDVRIDIMVTKHQRSIVPQYVANQQEFYDIAMKYYKTEQAKCLEEELRNLKITSAILFQKDKVITQMFGNDRYGARSFAHIANIAIDP
jgi:hypothetical protein